MLDINMGGSGQDINTQNDKCMSFEMSMLIMQHVHHLNTGIEGKKATKVPKSICKYTRVASPIS